MNREIKFRYRIRRPDGTIKTIIVMLDEIRAGQLIGFIRKDILSCDEYTGLHDKNGKEIYEGDIVRYYGILPLTLNTHPEGFMEVVYDEGYFGVRDMGTKHGRVANVCFVNPDDWYEVTVIGNIYENPELLEAK